MKIAIEAQRVFRKKKHGMDFVALELIRSLQKMDSENEYFVFVKPDEDKCLESSSNVHIIELGGGAYPIWEQRALPAAVKDHGCELLHCTSNTAPVNCPVPLVVTVHDIIYLESIILFKKEGSLYQKFGNLYRRWNVPKVVKNAAAITTVSQFEKSTIAARFPDLRDKIYAVYNGVSDHFQPVTDAETLNRVKKQYNLPEEFIFFLGNTDPKKNTPNVIKAYEIYLKEAASPLPLVMIDLGEAYFEAMMKQSRLPGLRENIHVTDYIKNTDLPAIYSMSSLFLYPSKRESFGIPMLEAMKCGVPVVTSNTSSMPEVSGDAAMQVNPGSPKSIAEATMKVLQNKQLQKQLITKGFERAQLFTWENMAKEMLGIYKNILQD